METDVIHFIQYFLLYFLFSLPFNSTLLFLAFLDKTVIQLQLIIIVSVLFDFIFIILHSVNTCFCATIVIHTFNQKRVTKNIEEIVNYSVNFIHILLLIRAIFGIINILSSITLLLIYFINQVIIYIYIVYIGYLICRTILDIYWVHFLLVN
jgi:hypothetical protein